MVGGPYSIRGRWASQRNATVEECEVDEDCGALLLRRLPKGFSETAWEKLDRPAGTSSLSSTELPEA